MLNSKRNRSEQLQEDQQEIDKDCRKKPRSKSPNFVWDNLKIINSLQNKDIDAQGKVEIAFDYVSSLDCCDDRGPEVVTVSRLVTFLVDWVQPMLISSDKGNRSSENWDSCLDYRCWAVLGFCLRNSAVGVSPNLLLAVMRVVQHVLVEFQTSANLLLKQVLECMSLLFSSNARAFYNAGPDLWVSCAVEVVKLVRILLTSGEHLWADAEILRNFSSLFLKHFASYLRFYPNPKNVFRTFVDRLLEQFLELLVLLHVRENRDKGRQEGSLLMIIEDVISHGLFHPAHISGFLSTSSLKEKLATRESRGSNESYHRHLFQKLEKIIAEKKAVPLGGFGYLLRLFVRKLRSHKGDPLTSKGNHVSASTEVLEENKGTSAPLFATSVQILNPLLLECKRCAEVQLLEKERILENRLVEFHCMLKSVNETLSSFIYEKIYVRMEDSSEKTHFEFLKEVYDIVIYIARKIYKFWVSALQAADTRICTLLCLIAKEIFAAVGYLLEIEYEVLGDDLVNLWLIMFSYQAIQMPLNDSKACSLLVSELSNLGCRLINIYKEIRQVDNAIFALCKALRLYTVGGVEDSRDYSVFFAALPLSSEMYVRALTNFCCLQEFRAVISKSIDLSVCIQQLIIDLRDSLEWIRHSSSLEGQSSGQRGNILSSLSLRAELLGTFLCEVYAIILDSTTVSATNSEKVGNAVENLITEIRPSFNHLIQNSPSSVNSFIFSLIRNNAEDEVQDHNHVSKIIMSSTSTWFFIFFFRIYASCRSLFQQSISLMPPDKSRKASEALGNLYSICSGVNWRKKAKSLDEGYFSWIAKPSTSLLDVINYLSSSFPLTNSPVYPKLLYVLHLLVLQRLSDLNRKIKAFEFLQDADLHMPLGNSGKHKSTKRWDRLITASEHEASGLTDFICCCFPLLAVEKSKLDQSSDSLDSKVMLPSDNVTWDKGICSLDRKSLPVSIWWLLCRNIDIWCYHANKKDLKWFLSHVLRCAFPCDTDVNEQLEGDPSHNKLSMHSTATELVGGTVLYEQTVLFKYLMSRFCHLLNEFHSTLIEFTGSSCKNSHFLTEWSGKQTISTEEPVVSTSDCSTFCDPSCEAGSSFVPSDFICESYCEKLPFTPFIAQLGACESLLYAFSRIPVVDVAARSFSVYATNVLNLERFLISFLKHHCGESSTFKPFKVLRLFIACRRALKHLVVSAVQNKESTQCSYIVDVFSHSTLLWLVKSVHELFRLPQEVYGEQSDHYENKLFSLIDHTSNIILAISKGQLTSALIIGLNKEEALNEHCLDDLGGKNIPDSSYQQPQMKKRTEAWRIIELMAEMLNNQVKDLAAILNDNVCAIKPEACLNALNWNYLSSVIASLQGFLWGLALALDDMQNECSIRNEKPLRFSKFCYSRLSAYVAVFEDFMYRCIGLLLTDSSQECGISSLRNYLDSYNSYDLQRAIVKGRATAFSSFQEENYTKDCLKEQGEEENLNSGCVRNNPKIQDIKNSGVRKKKYSRAKWMANVFGAIQEIDLSDLQNVKEVILLSLLEGKTPERALAIRHLFMASAAILKLKCMLSLPSQLEYHLTSKSMVMLVRTSYIILQGIVDATTPDPFTFTWTDGILKYLEVIGDHIHYTDPNSSTDVYARLVVIHLRLIGKCISLQGKEAALTSHDLRSNAKMLRGEAGFRDDHKQFSDARYSVLNKFKAQLRMSFRKLIRSPAKLHMEIVLESIVRALIGVQHGFHMVYEVRAGYIDGGKVTPLVAGGIDGLDMVLEYATGKKLLINESISSLVCCLLNIIVHLESEIIFYTRKIPCNVCEVKPDGGVVVLMCIEVLTAIVGSHSLQMDRIHVSQCLHIPMSLFKGFHHLRASSSEKYPQLANCLVDSQFSIQLFSSCCKLLYTTIKHQKRVVESCISLLQDSARTLLCCLETVDTNLIDKSGYFAWAIDDATICASFLRRVYEEIRHQKDALGKYSVHFLSSYISIYSGFGPLKTDIKREINEALKPGIYALVDVCTASDLQQLHTALSEGTCRANLSTLISDYKLNFQYEGKV